MQEPALTHAPRHFVRMACGPSIYKVVHFCSLLLYILALELAVDDMATYYSHYCSCSNWQATTADKNAPF
jgi:hypothetical protein